MALLLEKMLVEVKLGYCNLLEKTNTNDVIAKVPCVVFEDVGFSCFKLVILTRICIMSLLEYKIR